MRNTAVRAASMRLPRTVIAITAGVLSLLLFAIQIADAAACFTTSHPVTAAAQPTAPLPGEQDVDDDCDESPLLVFNLTKSHDAKYQDVLPELRGDRPPRRSQTEHLNATTRGDPVRTNKAPLFLQTGRLRN